jgi:CDP-glucose 4,6-dehydratase
VAVDPAFWDGRPVFVTGHSGFKGSWLSLWLESMGARVTGFSPSARVSDPAMYDLTRAGEGLDAIPGDVRDADGVANAVKSVRPEVVIHLAAQPIVRRSYRDPGETYAVNVMGTMNLLDAVRATDSVRAVVVVTSDKCYENRGLDRGYREDDPLGGADPYSSSKACQEILAASYRSSFLSGRDGAQLATGRAGNVIGGGDWAEDRLVPDLMRAAAAGERVTVRNPVAIRPWQHVLEPLSGYLMLAERLFGGPGFAGGWNFGPPDGDSRPVGVVVKRMAELWPGGIEHEIHEDPDAPAEAPLLKLDSTKAREQLGWAPGWGLDDALRGVVDWHVAHREGGDVRALAIDQIHAHQAAQCAR